MSLLTFRKELPFPPEDLFAWHFRPGAFHRLNLPWNRFRLLSGDGRLAEGAQIAFTFQHFGFSQQWVALIDQVEPGRQYRDIQLKGPFSRWRHTSRFLPAPGGSLIEDEIEFELPGGAFALAVGSQAVERRLNRMFSFRQRRIGCDLVRHRDWPGTGLVKVAVTGAGGLVGSALCPFLTSGGHEVLRVTRGRGPAPPGSLIWDPDRRDLDLELLEGIDAVVHLAGENIAAGRWNPERKAMIRESRLRGTRLLAESLARLRRKPAVLVAASAIGLYGDRGADRLDEESLPGEGFLADLCREWEAATHPAVDAGIRVVNLRFGIVLAAHGGALKRMLLPFQLGLGGPTGNGRQYLSWIALDDLVGIIHHALGDQRLSGPVNAVAPEAVTSREFAGVLGRVLHRPAVLPIPAPAIRLALGEMGEALLLTSTRAHPGRLLAAGFRFETPRLTDALAAELGL